jgi:uncharacterized repeat protein (TIGR03803 family)
MMTTKWSRVRLHRIQRRAAAHGLASAVVLLALVVAQPAQAQTYSVLHGFTGRADGANPFASLIQDASGNLYGTTRGGGNDSACPALAPPGCGVVFKLDPDGNQTVLYTFTGPPDGANPTFGMVMDASGNLYGTAGGGGNLTTCYGGCGVVFKLDPSGHETLLYSFTGGRDGSGPTGVLVQDASGNLYGTTIGGGVQTGSSGFGVVYKLDPSGHETVLYSFSGGADGGYPAAGVIRDAAGNLYGTAWYGGAFNEGVVFKIDTSNTEKVLYSFTGRADGGSPFSGLVRDPSGNLYGTTEGGGNLCGAAGCGVVFKLDTNDNESVLHSFSYPDGAFPESATLIRDTAGNLYGVTYGGGTSCSFPGCGVVFKLDASGNETLLHSFTATGGDGENPSAGLRLDGSGSLYGTTVWGGTPGLGTMFKLTPLGVFKRLTVTKGGSGAGRVTSSPPGINCGTACSANFGSGTVVKLRATPASGSTFSGWSGACTGTRSCSVTMSAAKSVTATFKAVFKLTVTKGGSGAGTVTSSPPGINCGTACSANFSSGTVVKLRATPASGSTFSGWSGACTGTRSCSVTMSGAKSVKATFN